MSFRKYEEYKESGVEWLGEIPKHWVDDPNQIEVCMRGFSIE